MFHISEFDFFIPKFLKQTLHKIFLYETNLQETKY